MKGKTKKQNKKVAESRKKVTCEIVGILILSFGLFLGIAIYFTESSGVLGPIFANLFKGLFGVVAFAFPILFIIIGVLAVISYNKNINRSRLASLIIIFSTLICLIHLTFFEKFDDLGFFQFVESSYTLGKASVGAGALFSPLIYLTYSLIGLAGTYILFISVILINIILLTRFSLKAFFNKSYEFLRNVILTFTNNFKDVLNRWGEKRKAKNKSNIQEYSNDIKLIESGTCEHQYNPTFDTFTDTDVEKHNIKIIDFEENTFHDRAEIITEDFKNSVEDKKVKDDLLNMEPIRVHQEALPYMFPPISLLKKPKTAKDNSINEGNVLNNAKILEGTLESFGVSAKVLQVNKGPVITRYELQPSPGVKVSRIVNLADDIALNLAASGVRIEAPIPGKAAIGVEVPNKEKATVYLREVLDSEEFKKSKSKLSFALGKDIAGRNIIADISKMPHLLIAGATGSGKSVCLNTLILSILYKADPGEVKLIMIDPKVVELSTYNGIPHLLIPVVTDPKKASSALNWAVQEMGSRYKKFADKGVRDIEGYNEALTDEGEFLPQIVVIIDELADLMMVAPNEVEDSICRLAQMARAAGIHLVIATQRPSVDVITGVIKANIPSRIAFAVSSQTDSRTILDMGGAEKLLGRGDMLYYPVGYSKPIRVQGCYISEKEVESVVNCTKNQNKGPDYNKEVIEEVATEVDSASSDDPDELLTEAVELVVDAGQASISMIQRRLRVGYTRAARMIDDMEVRGIVSGFDGSKPRNVLITKEEFQDMFKD